MGLRLEKKEIQGKGGKIRKEEMKRL